MDEDEMIERAVRQVARNVGAFIVGALLCGLVGLLMGSCRTVRYVSVPEYHTEYRTKTDSVVRRDSVWVRDSVSVWLRGDTVYREKWRTRVDYRYVYRNVGDTVLRTDSVRVPYPVERKLGWWEERKQEWFVPVCCVCGGLFVTLWWIIRRRRSERG